MADVNGNTRRYILIESNSGYVWGEATTTDPISAAREVDVSTGCGEARSYSEHRASSRAIADGTDGYYVYDATGSDVQGDDGQNADYIRAVEALPLVALVTSRAVNAF